MDAKMGVVKTIVCLLLPCPALHLCLCLSPFSCLPVSICVSKCAVLSNTNYTLNKQSLTKETPGVVVVVVAFSSLARIVGEGCTIHSTPVLLNLLKAEISSRTLITLFRPVSVHRGLAS